MEKNGEECIVFQGGDSFGKERPFKEKEKDRVDCVPVNVIIILERQGLSIFVKVKGTCGLFSLRSTHTRTHTHTHARVRAHA